jgi:hypothetical protein
MNRIKKSDLEKAERELRSIAERPARNFKSLDIDWKLIKNQLHRLDTSLREGEGGIFNEALIMLLGRLSPPNDELRGQIGPEPKGGSQSVPEPVWELLNHIVDKLHYSLTTSSDLEDETQRNNQPE